MEIIDASLEIGDIFTSKIITAVYKYVGSLIEKYMGVIEGVKTLLEEHKIDVKIALNSDTTDSCTK